MLGGGIAGYLEGSKRDDGIRVGLLSGVIGLAISLVVFLATFLMVAPEALGG